MIQIFLFIFSLRINSVLLGIIGIPDNDTASNALDAHLLLVDDELALLLHDLQLLNLHIERTIRLSMV